MAGNDTVQSVERAIDLLQWLASSENGLRLSDLASRLGLNVSTVHNLVRTLAGRGYVVKGAGQYLRLGPAIADLVAQEQERGMLRGGAQAGLELQRAFPLATVNLAEMAGAELRIRIRLSSDRPGLIQRPVSQLGNPYGSAVGLCCQAFADQGTVQMWRERHPFHEHAVPLWGSPEVLAEHLAQARRQGHVETPFPKQELWRVAFPVFLPGGQFLAALGLALPVAQAVPEVRREAIAAVRAAAARLAPQERKTACTP
ncbi:MAG: helix-turn-helix domain-containing protein [Planctomycetota bacterium]|nr:helix-turn-helix domain-containing protein [Planctomycetota bacterium]